MTPIRLLVVLAIFAFGIAVPVPEASASTSTTDAGPSDGALASAAEHQAAQDALADAREALAETVGQRKVAESELALADEAIRAAQKAVEDAAGSLEHVSQRLRQLQRQHEREHHKLRLEARESYKEGNGGVAGAAALDVLLHQDDAADALHRGGALRRVASKRADKVVELQSLSDRIAEAQREQAQLLLARRDGLDSARRARDERQAAMDVLAEMEARRAAAERAAEDVVAALTATSADQALSQEQVQRLSTLALQVDSLRAFSASTGVPEQLARYRNGRLPEDALVPIGVGGHRLWAPAAEAFASLRVAAAREGIRIGVTDSYRSYAGQVKVAEEKGLYAEGGLAARPGTSDHGWGLALDLDLDARALAWMRTNGPEFGFVEDTPREPWHWAFHGRA